MTAVQTSGRWVSSFTSSSPSAGHFTAKTSHNLPWPLLVANPKVCIFNATREYLACVHAANTRFARPARRADLPADTPQDFVELTSRCLKKDKTTRPTASELLHSEPMLTWALRRQAGPTANGNGIDVQASVPTTGVPALAATTDHVPMAHLAATSSAASCETSQGTETRLSLDFTQAVIPPGLRQLHQWRTHAKGAGGSASASDPLWQHVDALVGKEVVAMSAGKNATAVVTTAGELFAWRAPGSELEDAAFATTSRPTRLGAASEVNVSRVAMGDEKLLLLDSEGQLLQWLVAHASPLLVKGMPAGVRVVGIGCGSEHSVACTEDGRIFSWGVNEEGQLGVGDDDERDVPCLVPLPEGETARDVSCAGESTFVLTASGRALSCGSDQFRQLGRPAPQGVGEDDDADVETSSLSWMAMPASVDEKLLQISSAPQHGAALTSDGRVVTWGFHEGGRLGRKRVRNASDPMWCSMRTS